MKIQLGKELIKQYLDYGLKDLVSKLLKREMKWV